ncbi:heat shock factor 2-binding protein-like isoform X1 [Mytilus edulis]|uniref:heat shock factor 2-binding protein-like isoform X1 n=1 Tax=Mytilus edulis TaxID=6550 RepID=UPI0039EFAEAA
MIETSLTDSQKILLSCHEYSRWTKKKFLIEVKQNYTLLVQEWNLLNKEIGEKLKSKNTWTVDKEDLSQLAAEIAQLKENLPKVLNKNVLTAASKINLIEEELQNTKKLAESKQLEASQWKARCEVATADCQKEKEENIKLKCEVQELTQQLSQQSDYCSSLGSACCTLLWRVSKNEESIQSILVGSKIDEFLCLVSNTLESYLSAYKEEWPQDTSEEQSFILALCGIITNIAASALGRDFLVTNQYGRQLIDTYLKVLSEAPNGKAAKLKNLILMSLYNISINQKGIKYICTKKGLLSLLSWILQDEKIVDNRVNSLRLIQSIICEDVNISLIHELEEALPNQMFEEMLQEKNRDIKELALEILSDIQQHKTHEQ